LYEFVLFPAVPLPNQLNTVRPVTLLKHADYFLVVPLDLPQIIINELAPSHFDFTFKLQPLPLELIHLRFLLMNEMALPQRSICSVLLSLVAIMASHHAAVWSELLSLKELI
jgi:hypothetical protein